MKIKKPSRIQATTLVSALLAAGLLSPFPGLANTLTPQPKASRPALGRLPSATQKTVASRPAARPAVARAPLAKTPAAVKKPAAASLPPGGQLLLQTRNGARLTTASLAHLSQVAGKRLTVTHNYGEGEYVLRAHGAVGTKALQAVASRLKTNSSILRAHPYVAEAALQYQAVSGRTYVLVDPKVARTPAMRRSVLTLKPKQVLGAPVPVLSLNTP